MHSILKVKEGIQRKHVQENLVLIVCSSLQVKVKLPLQDVLGSLAPRGHCDWLTLDSISKIYLQGSLAPNVRSGLPAKILELHELTQGHRPHKIISSQVKMFDAQRSR